MCLKIDLVIDCIEVDEHNRIAVGDFLEINTFALFDQCALYIWSANGFSDKISHFFAFYLSYFCKQGIHPLINSLICNDLIFIFGSVVLQSDFELLSLKFQLRLIVAEVQDFDGTLNGVTAKSFIITIL